MYYVCKTLEVSGAHWLTLNYESPCQRLHGHNWKIKVFFRSRELNQNGMIIDFKHVKEKIMSIMDHQCLNDIININPTAENIARFLVERFEKCYRAEVWESEGNLAIYEEDE